MGRRRPPACRCIGFRTLHVGESMSLALSYACMGCPDPCMAHFIYFKMYLQHSKGSALIDAGSDCCGAHRGGTSGCS